MKILGIDPGIATTGFAFVEKTPGKLAALDYGVISTSKHLALPERLRELAADIHQLIKTHKPNVAAVESLFFFKNQKTAFAVAQARGVVLCTLAESGVMIKEITPLQVKQAITGYGRADKKQIQKMVQQIYNLPKLPQPDDAADALAIAFTAT
jgi:crossover junction endodeoxyribonuclease RuvC